MACLNFPWSCPSGAYTSHTEIQLQNLKNDSPAGIRLDLLFMFTQMSALPATKLKRKKIMCIAQIENTLYLYSETKNELKLPNLHLPKLVHQAMEV